MDFAIQTENLRRIYKIRGGKKSEHKELVALLGILIGLTIFFSITSFVVFRLCEHRARERGMIDMVTNY